MDNEVDRDIKDIYVVSSADDEYDISMEYDIATSWSRPRPTASSKNGTTAYDAEGIAGGSL